MSNEIHDWEDVSLIFPIARFSLLDLILHARLQSRYYVHFRANILGKGMNRLILPAMG